MSKQKLVRGIGMVMASIRGEVREGFRQSRSKFTAKWINEDPLADVMLWTDRKTNRSQFGTDAVAVLTFDGAGHEYFSLNSDFPMVSEKNKENLRYAAEEAGYGIDTLSSCAIAFYA